MLGEREMPRRKMRSVVRMSAYFIVSLTLGACRSKAPEPNFIVVVFDALRADHVAALGYRRDTTPTIDRLGSRGVLFTNCTSQGN